METELVRMMQTVLEGVKLTNFDDPEARAALIGMVMAYGQALQEIQQQLINLDTAFTYVEMNETTPITH